MTREVLVGYLHHFVKVYLDDIIVYSDSLEEHAQHLAKVFERLRLHNLRISPAKCTIARQEIEFLGYQISGNTTRPLQKHILDIQNFSPPKTKRQLQSFLGTLNWVREYIPNVAEITIPLTKLLQKTFKFLWTRECQNAFDELKRLASRPLVLHRPDFSRQFNLHTDASTVGISAVLWQEGEGQRCIISYSSSTLSDTEKRYHINEIETMAAVYGIRKYSHYLLDKPFNLYTDSRALLWLNKNKDTKGKLMRWSLTLQEYAFNIIHVPGKDNELADYLSRNPEDNHHDVSPDLDRLMLPEINFLTQDRLFKKIVKAQKESTQIKTEVLRLQTVFGSGPKNNNERQLLQNYSLQDDLLYRVTPNGNRLVVPRRSIPLVLHNLHSSPDAAHPGQEETLRSVQRRYYFRGLHKHVRRFVESCLICASVRNTKIQQNAPLKPRSPTAPFEAISVDILGPYPVTREGYRFIFIAEDIFTKWVEAAPSDEAVTSKLLRFLEENVFARYGHPKTIISDNGSTFVANNYLKLCQRYNITPYYTPVSHQRANCVERRVQELKKVLRTELFGTRQNNLWASKLSQALLVLRTRKNKATGMTPSKALYGYELPMAGDWSVPTYTQERRADEQAKRQRRSVIRARQLEFNTKNYAQDPKPPVTFDVGDRVMAREVRPNRHPFAPIWTGPHTITERVSAEVYKFVRGDKEISLHVDKLRPAPDDAHSWWSSDSDTSSDSTATPVTAQSARARSSATASRILPRGDCYNSTDDSSDDEAAVAQGRATTTVAIVHNPPRKDQIDESITNSTVNVPGPRATSHVSLQAQAPTSIPTLLDESLITVDVQAHAPTSFSPQDAGPSEVILSRTPEPRRPVRSHLATPPILSDAVHASAFIDPSEPNLRFSSAQAPLNDTLESNLHSSPAQAPHDYASEPSLLLSPAPGPIDVSKPDSQVSPTLSPASYPELSPSHGNDMQPSVDPAEVSPGIPSGINENEYGHPPTVLPVPTSAETSSAPPDSRADPNLVPAGRILPRRRRRARHIICNEWQCSVVFRECA